MKIIIKFFRKFFSNPKVRKFIGVFLVIFGFIGLVTPFTPWGFLFFVGLEMVGIRVLFIEKWKKRFLALKFFQKTPKV